VAVHEAPHVRIYAVDFEEMVPKAQLQRAEAVLIARASCARCSYETQTG
jgi:hypothetical protein